MLNPRQVISALKQNIGKVIVGKDEVIELLLIALMKGPSHYDPVCRPERFAQRYPWAAKRAGFADAGSALRAALARMRPSACPESGTAPAP